MEVRTLKQVQACILGAANVLWMAIAHVKRTCVALDRPKLSQPLRGKLVVLLLANPRYRQTTFATQLGRTSLVQVSEPVKNASSLKSSIRMV